jgi:hypothetical protein
MPLITQWSQRETISNPIALMLMLVCCCRYVAAWFFLKPMPE